MEQFKKRLVEFARKRFDMGQNAFEDYCGINRGIINSIKVQGPTASIVTKISHRCPELNLNWLFTGDGPMLNGAETNQTIHGKTLPLIPIEAFAGPGLPAYEDEKIQDYYTVTDFKESDFLIRVKGDSMSPKYCGGDLVACKRVTETYFLQWGRCYVIFTKSQGVMIKRVQPSEMDGCIKCVSDNPKYAPFDVPKEDVMSIALVNGAITLE